MNLIREQKGQSRLELISDYVVLDLETTGLSPEQDSIIEIGAIKVHNGEIVDEYVALVNPLHHISDFITDLTGITNEMLINAPTLDALIDEVLNFIGDSVVVGHNVNFDINFMYDSCMSIINKEFTNDFIDTLRLSRKLFKGFDNHKLSTLENKLNLKNKSEHRVLADCICTYELYEYIKQYMSDHSIDIQKLFPNNQRNKSYRLKAADIISGNGEFDESNPIYDKVCVFTGALENFTRKEAMQIVANLGGINGDNVTKKTNFLILGNNDYCASIKDGKSAKQKKAEQLILNGHDLTILPENVFYDMIGDNI